MDDRLTQLLALARRKQKFDKDSGWAQGAERYLEGLEKEITEVREEMSSNRRCYLEDELGDLLWNLANSLTWLEAEERIDIDAVLMRAVRKYEARMDTIENGGFWRDIKAVQKAELKREYQAQGS